MRPYRASVAAPPLAVLLRGELAASLGVDAAAIDGGRRFADLGLNSLLAVRFLDRVNRATGQRMGVEVLFEHSSLDDLTAALVARNLQPVTQKAPASRPAPGDVAIIGMAGRFPGSADIDAFWEHLRAGDNLVREITRWDPAGFYDPDPAAPGRSVTKWAGLLDGIDRFDAGFFGISPREAAAMDPQQRLFLEQAWLAIEDAGYPADALRGRAVGVYVGAAASGYDQLLVPDAPGTLSYGMTGNLVSLLAARIAYALDLRGPALVVDTACSASLVAVHLACQALAADEIEMALVGGVRVFLDPQSLVMMSRLGMLSPTGRCRSFDAAADGIAVGEAAAALLLKPLARALADGDRIDAVIRGTGTNQDGRSNGITAPNGRAQADLVRGVLARTGVAHGTVGLIEAHGTGTALGDPIELAALRAVFPADGPPVALGSVKTNIGHTSEAAGIAGLVKAALCLRHRTLAPSLGFSTLNPRVEGGAAPFVVPVSATPWESVGPRRAGVSSFGLSGTNAHALLEEAPSVASRAPASGRFLFTVSARTAAGLAEQCGALAAWLRGPGALARTDDVACTLAQGRTAFEHRAAFLAHDVAGVIAILDSLMRDEVPPGAERGRTSRDAAPGDPARTPAAFVAGGVPDATLFPHALRTLRLPPTRFEREVHWPPARHPLLDAAAAPGETVKTFARTDAIVRDHVIDGVSLLHAGVFLEMARLAARRAGHTASGLSAVAWMRPVAVPPEGLRVRAVAAPDGAITLLVGDDPRPFARARAATLGAVAATRDPRGLVAGARRRATRAELDLSLGSPVHLGPSFPGFQELWLGPDWAVSRATVEPDGSGLPPGLSDAAIQTAAALLAQHDGAVPRVRFPATLAALDVHGPMPEGDAWLLARPTSAGVDVELCDEAGQVRVAWRGLDLRESAGAIQPSLWRPVWRRTSAAGRTVAPQFVIATKVDAGFVRQLGGLRLDPTDVDAIAAVSGRAIAILAVAETDDALVFGLHRLVRALAGNGGDQRAASIRVITGNANLVRGDEMPNPAAAALEGLAKAVAVEFPAWDVVVVDADPAAFDPVAVLAAERPATNEAVALRDGATWCRHLEPAAPGPGNALRPGGLYLVAGGMGRVGRRVCRALVDGCGAKLLVVGRSPLDPARAAVLADWPGAIYVQADIGDAVALQAAIAAAEATGGPLRGVVQAVVDPTFGRTDRMTEAALRAALRPKTAGIAALAAATSGRTLDWFAVFSSIGAFAGFPGTEGQSSYCAACCHEAAAVARLRRGGVNARVVHWGLWADPALDPAMVARLGEHGCAVQDPVASAATFLRLLDAPDWQLVHAALSPSVWEAMGAAPGGAFGPAVAAARDVAAGVTALDTALAADVERYARALVPDAVTVQLRHAMLGAALDDIRSRREPIDPVPLRRDLIVREPALEGPLALLDTCAAALPDVLAGRIAATEVLFPGGSSALVEAVYRDQPVLAACGAVVAAAVAAMPGAVSVVEIGAGTGATTALVMAALDGRGSYLFTDIAPGFVRAASARLAGEGRRFAVLDITQDPAGQGAATGMADVVIASNVLHATPDIGATLRHLAALLRPGGVAILNEMTQVEDFATLTFGLLDGWWTSADPSRRLSHGPLLSPQGWTHALHAAGFDLIERICPAGAAQTVLLARKGVQARLSVAAPATTRASASRAPTTATAPRSDLALAIRVAVGAALDLPPGRVELDVPFGEIGVDSIVSPQIAEAINAALGASLRPTDLYNFATVTALAAHLAARLPDNLPTPEQPAPILADPTNDDRIAIIGMAGRFPGAPDAATFWDNIVAGRSTVREVDRFPLSTTAKWAGLLDDHDAFDPLFFSISPAEAAAMDPQQRVLLQAAWHALEDAGLPPQRLSHEACGVFVGASANNYVGMDASPALQTIGASMAILSARLSYYLDLQGPAFPVDTGCSSSLVALHLACQSLRTAETRVALAAGVSVNIISPALFEYLDDAGMASPTGQCRSFDDGADGFVPAEGVGVVVLKRLVDALADGDRVHAIVAATGINQDGRTSGMTAPSATSQTALERRVHQAAGIDPATIGLVEAHGTGTRLGDPIEVAALTDAFAGVATGSCALGSVKTNIGHAMAAAGMAGLIKAVQALRHRVLPPSLNFVTANRHIDFAATPFRVNTAARPWPEAAHPRRACISSFGFSGTNAHVVIEEAPPIVFAPPPPGPVVLRVSARSEAALAARLVALADWIERHDTPLADVADTLTRRRAHFRWRRTIAATTRAEAVAALRCGSGTADPAYESGAEPDITGLARPLVDLPLYPFAQERFWSFEPLGRGTRAPHALLDRRLPSDMGAAFETTLGPNRPILRDHMVGGRTLLPGTAFLEMARASAGLAAASPIRRLRDVAWRVPVMAGVVRVEAVPSGDGFAVTLRAGSTVVATAIAEPGASVTGQPFDLAAIRARCTDRREGPAVYDAFTAMGFTYGPSLRVIESLHLADGEALGRLRGADAASILDGALQVAAGMGLRATTSGLRYVPAGIDAVVFGPAPETACWAHATLLPGDMPVFDVTVLDAAGTPLVSFERVRARALHDAAPDALHGLASVWEPAPLEPAGPLPDAVLLFGDDALATAWRALGQRVILAEPGESFAQPGPDHIFLDPTDEAQQARLLALLPSGRVLVAQCLRLSEPGYGPTLAGALLDAGLDAGLRPTLALVRAALATGRAMTLLHVDHAAAHAPLRAVGALGRGVAAETSQVRIRTLGVGPGFDARCLRDEIATVNGADEITCGQLRTRRMRVPTPLPAAAAWARPGSTWLITGGLGGLGLLTARYLAAQGAGRIALLGRTPPGPAQIADLAALEAAGAEILTLQADVGDPAALRAALMRVRRAFGPLHGVIHAAGVLRDGLLAQLLPDDADAVLGPKIAGAVALDHLTASDPLEAFILFSSTAASLGGPGQALYAAANAFLSGFAITRRARVHSGERHGATVAIEWPLWAEGGMQPPPEVVAELDNRLGMRPMPAAEGMAAIGRFLAGPEADPMLLFGRTAGQVPVAPVPTTHASPPDMLSYLCTVIGDVIRLAPERIDIDEPFAVYGIDSMTIVKLNARLEADLGEISKTMFFEARTVRELAAVIAREHGAAVQRHLTPDPVPQPVAQPVARPSTSDIAIIGIAGLFPGARDLDQFWINLRDGVDSVTEIPPDRWPLDGFYDPDRTRADTSYSKWGGFIEGVAEFDARFFGISPVEADMLDPQSRKFLEVCWATLEDAGVTRDTICRGDARRRGGVFVGVMSGDYQLFGPEEAARGNLVGPNAAYWNVANRVSSFLDLRGPSMAVDTACSSSLSAIHMACQALRLGECSVALAGGTNLTLHPGKHWILSKSGFASSDGRCRSFGAGGDGYVPGEGVGAVLLKPLARALADGDRIHAVIKGGAINHGGRTGGYTVPNPAAQADVITAALEASGVAPGTIGFIEAHGTGTALGDPVEVTGLARVFTGLAPGALPIGSVKSNIGHAEAAAGIAGVAKLVAQFRERMLAPSLHADALNPDLGLSRTPLVVQRSLAVWDRPAGGRRRAGISSFGAGGSNAHLVLEEAPDAAAVASSPGAFVVPLSAATDLALRERASGLAMWLRTRTAEMADVIRTLQTGREAMRFRTAFVAADRAGVLAGLDAIASGAAAATDVRRGVGQVIADAGVEAVAAQWAAGAMVDWDSMAPGLRAPMSLPTYPFEKRRCWFSSSIPASPSTGFTLAKSADGAKAVRLDPSAAAIADHVVAGRTILPGALLLTIIRAATGGDAMADIRFIQPVDAAVVTGLHVTGGDIWQLCSDAGLHASGRLADPAVPPPSDIEAVLSRCQARIAGDAVYAALAGAGAAYGPAYRRIDHLLRGNGEAVVALTDAASPDWAPVLDAALQASFAILPEGAGGPFLPAGIGRLELPGRPELAAAVHVVRLGAEDRAVRLSFTILDADGAPLAWADEVVIRQPGAAPALPPLRVLEPVWQPHALSGVRSVGPSVVLGDRGNALAAAVADALGAELVTTPRPDAICWLVPSDLLSLHRLLQGGLDGAVGVVLVTCRAHRVHDEAPDPEAAAMAAFARAVAQERPGLRLIVLDVGDPADAALLPGAAAAAEPEVAVRNGALFRKRFQVADATTPPAWRAGSTVLIAGAGGLACVLADHLLHAGCRVALLGRSSASPAIQRVLTNARAMHVRADLSDRVALETALDQVRVRFGPIDVAVHAAMVMHDAAQDRLSEADLDRVLAPKTTGLSNLVASVGDAGLLLFSSANAHTANPGQSAYAAASAHADAYALSLAPTRRVRIIDWGLWGEAGRVATPAHLARLARVGVYPIGTAEGLAVTDRLWAGDLVQAVPLRVSDDVAAQMGVVTGPGPMIQAASRAARALGPGTLAEAAVAFAAINQYAAARLHAVLPNEPSAPAQRRLRAAMDEMLVRHRLQPGVQIPRPAALGAKRDGLLADSPAAEPYLVLLETCVAAVPDVLAGRVDANAVLFPGGSSHLVARIYAGNAVVDHVQAILAAGVAAAVQARLDAGAKRVCIIEIGAGTGGTTGFVLQALAGLMDRVEYLFTDVGQAFLDAAPAGTVARRLDIGVPPGPQGFEPGSFDIAIAANVLHATRRIDDSIANMKALVREGGVLAINEATAAQDFNTLTFGLTRGWWLFEDEANRLLHAPLLDADRWRNRLTAAGCRAIAVVGEPALQCVILAESDGIAPETAAAVLQQEEGSVEDRLRRVVAAALRLGADEVEPDASFAEYGADSIISVELVRQINEAFAIELKTTALFNYATVRELAGYIRLEHGVADSGGTAVEPELADKLDAARARTGRLRRLIRLRFDGHPDGPSVEPEPPPAQTLLDILNRLERGELDVATAMRQTLPDA